MEVAYQYTKVRSEFGKACHHFADGTTQVLDSVLPTNDFDKHYITRNPTVSCCDTTPHITESEVNTETVVTKHASMRHSEGGWPKDVDFTEQGDVSRYRKKVEKSEEFQTAIKILGPMVEKCMKQNNAVDVYEQYFEFRENDDTDYSVLEPPSAKGLAVFRDPTKADISRTATNIAWHPDTGRLAVSYSCMRFQDDRINDGSGTNISSYIWNISNPNIPEIELLPPSPLCCLRFNPKSTDTLVGGCYNGMITYFDLRKPNAPTGQCFPHDQSLIENSHHDPVYDVYWISSKTGHQCASVSTDGQIMWWDTRKLGKPTDTIKLLSYVKATENQRPTTFGGCSLEYSLEAGPTKYLVGTEQGTVASLNLRNRKMNNGITIFDTGLGKHHGPIYSIQRNPVHSKYFMTTGDWTAKIWTEDLKTPIITTKYHSSYLTGGCWSPTRPGVFFVTRNDGVLDVWDYYYRQNEISYSHKVSSSSLSSISVQGSTSTTQVATGGGKLVAIGDTSGTVNLLEVCDSLATPQPNEKTMINSMFERETKREKNLEQREREMKRNKAMEEERRKKALEDKTNNTDDGDERMEEILRKIDEDFLLLLSESNKENNHSAVNSN